MSLEDGVRERERLRPYRVENYRTKKEAGFACSREDCQTDTSILVVKFDGKLTTRCQKHLEGEIRPGQWNAR